MSLKELQEAIHKQQQLKYPNMPAHAIPKKKISDKDANELQKAIELYLKFKGHYARRLSSEGRYRPGEEYENVLGKKIQMKGKWLPGVNVGMSDVFCLLKPNGRFLGIEVKMGSDRQSEGQIEFENDVKAVGGLYLVVKSWKSFIEQINKYVK